ncbi:NAD(P)-binding protein [Suillus subluteus]|nr:NAD(P)-binding protein [Suillus subluteus]
MSKGVALITGAGQGIGRSISLRLAADGFDIGLSDIPTNKSNLEEVAREITRTYAGRRACVLLADVTVEDDVCKMVDGVVNELGGLDVMVANAGIIAVAPLVETTLADWEKIFAVNVTGVFLSYKYAAQKMIALNETHKRGRRIIGASSLAGKKGDQYLSAYCASKFAVRGITQSAAVELGRHGITVNAYAPGIIMTAMIDRLNEASMKLMGSTDLSSHNEKKNTCVGYFGVPDDIAGLVSYIASPESHFITGKHYGIFFPYRSINFPPYYLVSTSKKHHIRCSLLITLTLTPSATMSKGIALITGAGQGIGRSISLRLAADGFDIGLSDIPTNKSNLEEVAREITRTCAGRRTCVLLADVTVEDDVCKMVDGVVNELGGLDVMVANAGIIAVAPLVETTLADWEKIFAVNVTGVFLSYKYAAQKMIALNETHKRGRRIIGASSLVGKRGVAYSASKFAVRGITQSAAIELGCHGITVNAYAPGPIMTAMGNGYNEKVRQDSRAVLTTSFKHSFNTCVGYLGVPDDIAGLVSYIASPESHFITGKYYGTFSLPVFT